MKKNMKNVIALGAFSVGTISTAISSVSYVHATEQVSTSNSESEIGTEANTEQVDVKQAEELLEAETTQTVSTEVTSTEAEKSTEASKSTEKENTTTESTSEKPTKSESEKDAEVKDTVSSKDFDLNASIVGSTYVNGLSLLYNGNGTFGINVSITPKKKSTITKAQVYVNGVGVDNAVQVQDNSCFLSLKSYSKVVDMYILFTTSNGQTFTYSLKSFEEFKDINTLVCDSVVPALSVSESGNTDTCLVGNTVYYTNDYSLMYFYGDSLAGVKEMTVLVNGEKFTDYTELKDSNGILIDTSALPEGKNMVEISVIDRVGNTSTNAKAINLLREVPEIKGVNHSYASVKSGVTYISDKLELKISGQEQETISSISVYKVENGSDVFYSSFVDNSTVIHESGEYKIRVVDVAGNSKDYSLSDLYNDLEPEVVSDTEKPVCSLTLNGGEINPEEWVTGKAELKITFKDNVELSTAKVTINGKSSDYYIADSTDNSIIINLAKEATISKDSTYEIAVSCFDLVNNESLEQTAVIKADFEPPKVDLSVDGTFKEVDGDIFIDGNIVVGTVNKCSDEGSGIDKIELLNGSEVVSSRLPFVISDSGKYQIRVTDKAGLSTMVSLSELMGIEFSNIFVDNKAPVIILGSEINPDLVDGDKNWFKSAPILEYSVEEDYLDTVSVSINGEGKELELTSSNVYQVDLSGYEGKVDVDFTCSDKFGHVASNKYSLYIDTLSPEVVDARLSQSYSSVGDGVFFKGVPNLVISATDTGVGVSGYRLSGSKEEENENGIFSLSSGEYYIEVLDKLGNTTGVKPLSELLNLKSNKLVVDSESPKITANKPSGCINGWYGSDVIYNINLSDNQGINSAKVTINGKVVNTFTASNTSTKSKVLTADTSKVKSGEDGMYKITATVTDNAGNTSTFSDTIYIDKEAPTIDSFVFTGDGKQESEVRGEDGYKFYFKGSASCDIYVSDGKVSSGLDKVVVKLTDSDGVVTKKELEIVDGVATVNIPNNFKGYVSAYAVDKVKNKSGVVKPNGIITEDSNCFINSVDIDIRLPKTSYTDKAGRPLYNKDISVKATVGCDFSGIRKMKWGIGSEVKGTVYVDNKGNISGDTANVSCEDTNLVIMLDKVLKVSKNTNNINLWVEVEDRVGFTSKKSKNFSIDKTSPRINVAFDKSASGNCYNSNRTARITVQDRNFKASEFKISPNVGSLGEWVKDGNTWSNTLTFSQDGEYEFSLSCTDRAGNASNVYKSEKFIIDKSNPVLSVSWDNESPVNGNYYSGSRTAHLSIVDRNFDASLITVNGGTVSGWSSSGDTHTASVSFTQSGQYELSVLGKDKAGNTLNNYSSGSFIVDSDKPTISIVGVEQGVSYKKDVSFTVNMSDSYIDSSRSSVVLVGDRNKEIPLKGSFGGSSGSFSFSDFPEEEATDDIYTIKATIYDMAGNSEQKELTFSVNRFGSSYEFAEPAMLGSYLSSTQDVSITEYNVDKLDTKKSSVVVIRDGNEIELADSAVSIEENKDPKGKYSYKYTVNKDAFKEDGKYLVQVFSTSKDGSDYSSVSEEYAFVLDRTEPEIIVSGVKSKERYHDYNKKLTIDVRDISGVKSISASLDGNGVELTEENGLYSFVAQESSDMRKLVVNVEDMAGNKSTKSVDDFLITSNMWLHLINQSWFKYGVGLLGTFVIAIIGLLFKSRHDSMKKEKSIINQTAEYSATTYSPTTGTKDMVEDLDKE